MTKKYPPRPWQIALIPETKRILFTEDRTHLYIQAPTGAGKSKAIVEIVDNLPLKGLHYVIVGRNIIANQHIVSFVNEEGCEKLNDQIVKTMTGQKIKVMTWQSCVNEVSIEDVGYLMFDECHMGGTGIDVESIPTIFSNLIPAKKIYISATPPANQKLLGQKRDHFFLYKVEQALADGILNPVDLCEIHSGTTAKIAKIRNTINLTSNVEELDELVENDCADLAERFRELGVKIDSKTLSRYKELNELRSHLHMETAAKVYYEKHYGEQALVFCSDISTANTNRNIFNSVIRKCDTTFRNGVNTAVLTSRLNDTEQEQLISDFEKNSVQVLFVVGMLQEGFNLPSLGLAFDTTFRTKWNVSSRTRLIQRLGRLMRKSLGKVTSRYYYFRDIFDYYPSENGAEMPEFDDDFIEEVKNEVERETAKLKNDAVNDESGPASGENPDTNIEGRASTVEILWPDNDDEISDDIDTDPISINEGKIGIFSTPFWYIKDLKDYNENPSFSFIELYGNSADKNKEILLEMARNGVLRPNKKKNVIGRYLVTYTNDTSSFDSVFNDKIRQLRPDWFEKSSEENKITLLEMARSGQDRPHWKSYYGNCVINYTNKTQCFDQNFNKEIRILRPDWFESSIEKNKVFLLEIARSGKDKPKRNSSLYNCLNNYTSKNNPSFDPIFNNEIRELRPDWIFVNSSIILKEKLLEMARNGDDRPSSSSSNIGKNLISYTTKTKKGRSCFDPVFDDEIRQLRPDWFEKSSDINKKLLKQMAKDGKDKPSRKTAIGCCFKNYVIKGSTYDKEFAAEIRKLRPDWFIQ